VAQSLIHSIELWEPDLGADITPSGNPSIWTQLEELKTVESLDDVHTLEPTFFPGAPLPLESPQVLTERTVLKVQYGATSPTYRLFRVNKVDLPTSAETGCKVLAEEMWNDLSDVIIRKTLAGGFTDLSVTFVGMTLSEVLTEVMHADYGLPATFNLGTVQAAIADEKVRVQFVAGSFLKFMRYLSDQILDGCEFEFVWDDGNGRYDINFWQQVGLTAGERSTGADPTLRPIQGPGGAGDPNRVRTSHLRDTRDFFNRIIPLSGDDENLVTIADAEFLGHSESPAGTIRLEPDVRIVHAASQFVGLFIGNADIGFSEILTSAVGPPNVFTTDGTEADMVGEWLRLAQDSAGSDLVDVDLKSSVDVHGPVERVERFHGISPYPNLMVREGHIASMDEGSGAADSWLPTGAAKVGSPDTNQNTDADFFFFGDGSLKVECNADGEGVEWELTFPADTDDPYASAWAHLVLTTGTVKVEIEGNDGEIWPPEEIASSNATTLHALTIGGMEPTAGTIKVKIIGITTGTVFYVDAVAVTRSAEPWQYADKMGPATLFEAAVRMLKDEGGTIPPSIDGEVLDVTAIKAGTEIVLGSHVEYKDLYLLGTPIIDVTSRVVEVTTYESPPPEGRFKKEIRLSSKRKDFTDRYKGPTITLNRQRAPSFPIPMISNITWKWHQILSSGEYRILFHWFANRNTTKSVKWELNETDVEPSDWTTVPTGGTLDGGDDMDATVESSAVQVPDQDPFVDHYLYVKPYPKPSGAGNPGPTKRVAITALPVPEPFIGGFGGLSCIPPDGISDWAMMPMIESFTAGEVRNFNEDFAPIPHGTIVSPGGTFLTFDPVEGLISTDTGATRYVLFDGRLIGEHLVRFQFLGQNIRKGTSAEIVLYITAGTAGVYAVTMKSDGILRVAVTSNGAESTVNIDSTLAILVGCSYQWAIQLEMSGTSPSSADIWLYLLTDTFSHERIHGVQSDPCAGEFNAIYALYSGLTSSRFLYAEGQYSAIKSQLELRAAGGCIASFAKAKGGTTAGINHDAYLVTDDTNFTVYDLAGAVVGQIAHGL
jgi:hypothetical protein